MTTAELLLGLLALATVIVVIRLVVRRSGPAQTSIPPRAEPDTGEEEADSARPPGPPSSGAGDPLEVMRAALPNLSSEEIEHLLEMGATLKPGTENLFREELRRRRQQGKD